MRWLGVIDRDVPSLFLSAPWSGKAESGNDPGVASAEGGFLMSPARATVLCSSPRPRGPGTRTRLFP